MRKEAKKIIGEIYILYPYTDNFNETKINKEFNATLDFSKIDLLGKLAYKQNIFY